MSDTYVVNTAGKPVIVKDPDALLDYTWDWTEWLTAIDDTITDFEITIFNSDGSVITDSFSIDHTSQQGMTIVAWLKGGVVGNQYMAVGSITTAAGRTDDRRIYLSIKDR